MPALNIFLDGEGIWPDMAEKQKNGQLIHITTPIGIAALARGLKSGKASVALRIDLPSGKTVLAETSLALFLQAADLFKARYAEQPTPGLKLASAPAMIDGAWEAGLPGEDDDDEETP